MNIDLYKIITHLDEVKIEVGAFGGRTLVYENSRFKMNDFVKKLIHEKQPLSRNSLKKIEKLNHALPENIHFIKRVLTSLRQFFGNIRYNRDKELFAYALSCLKVKKDSKSKLSTEPIEFSPSAPLILLTDPDFPMKDRAPLPPIRQLEKPILRGSKVKKVEFPKTETPEPPKPVEPARPKLQRSNSLNVKNIIKELKEKGEIDPFQLNTLGKDINQRLLSASDYEIGLKKVIKDISGESLDKAFVTESSRKFLKYLVSKIFTSEVISSEDKSKFIKYLSLYIDLETVKYMIDSYVEYLNQKLWTGVADPKDETLKYLLQKLQMLGEKDKTIFETLNRDSISAAIASVILSDNFTPKWLLNLLTVFKKDKPMLLKIDSILGQKSKVRNQREGDKVIISYLSEL